MIFSDNKLRRLCRILTLDLLATPSAFEVILQLTGYRNYLLTYLYRMLKCPCMEHVNGTPSHSYGVSLATWDHNVTFHPTQVNTPRLNLSQTGW